MCDTQPKLRLGTVVLGVNDIDRAMTFWSKALGYVPVDFPDAENEFTILVPASGEGTPSLFQRSETPPQEHPRIHLDLVVDSSAEQATEINRLVELDAVRVPWDLDQEDPDFVVLADPVANRFCVVDAGHAECSRVLYR